MVSPVLRREGAPARPRPITVRSFGTLDFPDLQGMIAAFLKGEGAGDAEFFAERQERIGRKGFEQREGRGQQAGAQASGAPIAGEDARVETLLQTELAFHSDSLREGNKLGAAREKNVLSIVDFDAVDFK